NGRLFITMYFFATHNCDISPANFPFDVNHCMMCFVLNGHYSDELRLQGRIGTGEFDYEIFKPRPFISVGFSEGDLAMSGVYYNFVITRQPQFWVCLIIIPTFFISMLVLIGIFFGDDSHSLNGLVEIGLTGMMSLTVIVGILNDSIAKSKDISALGRFVFFDIIIVVVAIIVVLLSHKLRIQLRSICDKRLKRDNKSSAFWLNVKRYATSNRITRYILFFIFFTLHLVNLITMLSQPEDTGVYEAITNTFNATY
ncbi:hypothetical protein PFISCL1PPCAC_1668, partial [Pristionchus fissidentatus]